MPCIMLQDATTIVAWAMYCITAGGCTTCCLPDTLVDSHFRLPPGLVTFAAGLEATAVLLLLGAALAGDLHADQAPLEVPCTI